MAKNKILFISNIAPKKVGSFSIASICATHKMGWEFHMASNFSASSLKQREIDEKEYDIKTHHVDFVRNPIHPKNIRAYRQLVNIICKEHINIIHCNTPVGGIYGRLAAKRCGIKKVIYQVHGFHFYKGAKKLNWLVYYPIEKLFAKITDKLITINSEDFEFAKRKLRLRNNGDIYYVPGVGIDTSEFRATEVDKNNLRRKIGLTEEDIVCISAGRLDANKNNGTLIKAISLLNDERFKLVICGSGEQEEELKALTKQLNVIEQVYFLGNRSDMKELYQISDIFVMASFREGLSRSIMEAMASGLPCVVSDIRGNRDLIIDGKGGYLANPQSENDFLEKLKLLIDISIRAHMKKYNYEAIKKYDINNVIGDLNAIYKEFI